MHESKWGFESWKEKCTTAKIHLRYFTIRTHVQLTYYHLGNNRRRWKALSLRHKYILSEKGAVGKVCMYHVCLNKKGFFCRCLSDWIHEGMKWSLARQKMIWRSDFVRFLEDVVVFFKKRWRRRSKLVFCCIPPWLAGLISKEWAGGMCSRVKRPTTLDTQHTCIVQSSLHSSPIGAKLLFVHSTCCLSVVKDANQVSLLLHYISHYIQLLQVTIHRSEYDTGFASPVCIAFQYWSQPVPVLVWKAPPSPSSFRTIQLYTCFSHQFHFNLQYLLVSSYVWIFSLGFISKKKGFLWFFTGNLQRSKCFLKLLCWQK
jgi:hypothetical protein